MDATSLLGGMLGAGFGRGRGSDGPGIGTVAVGVAGAAAVGGLGYLAYRHFKGTGAPALGAGPQMQGPGMQGAPGMQGVPGMQGAPGTPGQGGIGGFFNQMVGSSNSLRTEGFSAPGYEYQQAAAQSADGGQPMPQFAPWTRPVQAPPAAPAPSAAAPTAPNAAATSGAAPNYANLPPQPPAWVDPAAAGPVPAPTAEQQAHALLLIRAMVAAAYADGTLDEKERGDILSRLDQAGVTPAERAGLVQELDHPKPITALVAEAATAELAEQFYLVSLVSVNVDTEAERAHLRMLPMLLKLSPEQIASIHQKTGLPTP